MAITRRRLIEVGAALIGAGLLSSCCMIRKKPQPVCPLDPDFTDANSTLAIDVHAHIFNGTDLQVKDFVTRVAIRQSGGLGRVAEVFGGLLQGVAWKFAPTVEEEVRELEALQEDIIRCSADGATNRLVELREQKYQDGKAELVAATQARMREQAVDNIDLTQPTESLEPGMQGYQQILRLPDSYDELFIPPDTDEMQVEDFEEAISARSALKFLLEMFQYRYVSVYNYLNSYSRGSEIKIDLMTPALVDYDWWLSQGAPTRSRLPDQMQLMQRISLLSGGRVHALVPFDPYRQVVHELGGKAGFSPIELVQTSVEKYGAIGVKLYPPMGFAPFGNTEVGSANPDMWKRRAWLTEVSHRDDFPARLDAALESLYHYCATEGVPVMGHSNESNGPVEDFERLTGPDHWRKAVEGFSEVQFSFGHFGGVGSNAGGQDENIRAFLELMERDQQSGRSRVQADASYFSNVLENPTLLATTLKQILTWPGPGPGPAVDRLMYGADWKMLAAEVGASGYLRDFNNVFTHLETSLGIEGLKEKFFGLNAARYFGLQAGEANRRRLENFYDRHDLRDAPPWMAKVDNLNQARQEAS